MANEFGFFDETPKPKEQKTVSLKTSIVKEKQFDKPTPKPQKAKHNLNLLENESILHTYHQTPLVLAKVSFIIIVLVALPFLILWHNSLLGQYDRLLIAWAIIVFIATIRHWVIWLLNTYIITDKRLIKISHEGLFKKLVLETPLDRILNISFKTTGISSSLFNYGDVEVQVVGLMEPMILANISSPAEIKDYLWQVHNKFIGKEGQYSKDKIEHLQESTGYTKHNQKIL